MTRALVLVGAPGAGKTSVLTALATLLEIDGVPYGAIEVEQLTWGSPMLGMGIAATALSRVLSVQREAGRTLFLVAATPENPDELRDVLAALAADKVNVVCLATTPDEAAARIAEREPDEWPGKQRLIAHARHLADVIPCIDRIDVTIDTSRRQARDVAREIRDQFGPWM